MAWPTQCARLNVGTITLTRAPIAVVLAPMLRPRARTSPTIGQCFRARRVPVVRSCRFRGAPIGVNLTLVVITFVVFPPGLLPTLGAGFPVAAAAHGLDRAQEAIRARHACLRGLRCEPAEFPFGFVRQALSTGC